MFRAKQGGSSFDKCGAKSDISLTKTEKSDDLLRLKVLLFW